MEKLQSLFRNACITATVAGASVVASVPAFAALDMTAAQGAVTDAQDDGLSMGQTVIGVVAGLIVVGIIIKMIRKAG